MLLDRAGIAARIPHQGAMCLLDAVVAFDAKRIECRASSHRDPGNPLRAGDRLGAANAIEYAAQAMAVHGSLLQDAEGAGETPRLGYLVSVRGVELLVERIDDFAGDLVIVAERLSGDGNNILYQFSVVAGQHTLVTGRAAVVLDAASVGVKR